MIDTSAPTRKRSAATRRALVTFQTVTHPPKPISRRKAARRSPSVSLWQADVEDQQHVHDPAHQAAEHHRGDHCHEAVRHLQHEHGPEVRQHRGRRSAAMRGQPLQRLQVARGLRLRSRQAPPDSPRNVVGGPARGPGDVQDAHERWRERRNHSTPPAGPTRSCRAARSRRSKAPRSPPGSELLGELDERPAMPRSKTCALVPQARARPF